MSPKGKSGKSNGNGDPARAATVIYLTKDSKSPSHAAKLAGIRRYCASRRWDVKVVASQDFPPEFISSLMRESRPVGCIVDGVTNRVGLPPRLFRGIPVSYIGYMRGRTGNRPNFHFDTAAIAETAFRELSANHPPCYAAVGFPRRMRWPRQRVEAFRATACAAGAAFSAFPACKGNPHESWESFCARLVPWLAALPEHCAIFAVSDEVAVHVVRAAHAAARHIPRSLTLVSVDNFEELCESVDPPVSSIQLDFERAGFLAARAVGEQVAHGITKNDGIAPATPPILVAPLLVVRRKSTSGHGRHEKFIIEAAEIIRREACEGLTASDLLKRFPHSRRNFERRFREAMGHGILDEILHVRLERACSLLAQTDTAIGAIPDMCGFRSYRGLDFHFRSRFKMGMADWRRKNSR